MRPDPRLSRKLLPSLLPGAALPGLPHPAFRVGLAI